MLDTNAHTTGDSRRSLNNNCQANARRVFLVFALVVITAILPEAILTRDDVSSERLFVIRRNKNDNMVCYDALLRKHELDSKEPVKVYWIIPQEKNKVEELNRIERKRAYGFEIKKSYGADSVDISLVPLPREVRVQRVGNRWAAVTTINSVRAVLDSAYVMAEDGAMLPSVKWVKIIGRSVAADTAVVETITP